MEYNNKTVLIVGLAKSGVAVARFLSKRGAHVVIKEDKPYGELEDAVEQLRGLEIEYHLKGDFEVPFDKCSLAVVSPGVPLDHPTITAALTNDIPVISEIELAFRHCSAQLIAITGTNGKTTTTALTGEILKAGGRKTFMAGNIGIPMIEVVEDAKAGDVIVCEVSSFQLETICLFNPYIAAILNITEDHLNRHKTMDNYLRAKTRIYENQRSHQFLVINRDDNTLVDSVRNAKARVLYFSRKSSLREGCYVDNDSIVISTEGKKIPVCSVKDLKIPGEHNIENALAACIIGFTAGVSVQDIGRALTEFPGVEHRIEYVDTINGVEYYNDSKGTNPEASIRAINAMNRPIVLIAGGMDKGSDFSSFIEQFFGRVKDLVLLGETADRMEAQAIQQGFKNIHKVSSLEEAVNKSSQLAQWGDCVLLSPACASWDMFKDYEERGRLYKKAVSNLRR